MSMIGGKMEYKNLWSIFLLVEAGISHLTAILTHNNWYYATSVFFIIMAFITNYPGGKR